MGVCQGKHSKQKYRFHAELKLVSVDQFQPSFGFSQPLLPHTERKTPLHMEIFLINVKCLLHMVSFYPEAYFGVTFSAAL